jgi:hypothetical protein
MGQRVWLAVLLLPARLGHHPGICGPFILEKLRALPDPLNVAELIDKLCPWFILLNKVIQFPFLA